VSFQRRIIAAIASVVVISVLAVCALAEYNARSAVVQSADHSLLTAARAHGSEPFGEESPITGVFFQLVMADGTSIPTKGLPVDAVLRAHASARMPELIRTIHFRKQTFRQLLISLPVNTRIECPNESRVICVTEIPSVQVFSLNISGQQEQITDLNRNLIVVFFIMLAMGLALAVGAARTAVRPLVRVTADIESIDRRKNFSLRLEEGGLDEIGRLRRTFNSLLSTVEESQVLQQQLVMDASHELRTPLTSLRMNAELLQRSDLDSEEVHQITDDVVSQVDELASLTRDLVELARGEHSQGDIERLRLDEIVAECALTAKTHARVRNISLTTDLHPLALEGRHDRWERAISNLINNAIKFAPAGGQVRISTDSRRITVEDSGSGVIPAEREFVFERFWRSPSARSQPGSGLGLAIVAQVVAEHDCTIAVSSSDDLGGAAFIVTLPDAMAAQHLV